MITALDSGWQTVLWRHITPAAAGLEHAQNARDHGAVIDPGLARLALGQTRLNLGPGLAGQLGQISYYNLLGE